MWKDGFVRSVKYPALSSFVLAVNRIVGRTELMMRADERAACWKPGCVAYRQLARA
jgi:hypothetical protein